ncbi:MAG TPA: GNAT family N-acetyltransferase [Flavisolibacter sp.]|jgi:RimJ/RimL family protein N-acetyltransferase|nr:GNAT family N-acetyltransferase [Flavisolibacter sp.]
MVTFRRATSSDANLFFEWANDPDVRQNSYNQDLIAWEDHIQWFEKRVDHEDFVFLVFYNGHNELIGQVRFQKEGETWIIGISIDREQRGKGYSIPMLNLATSYLRNIDARSPIIAFVKVSNRASYQAFLKAGFRLERQVLYKNKYESFKLIK